MFIAPALTAGAISGERERQTLDILLSSKMKPYSIILGKLFASLSQIILLLVASMPMFTIGLMIGGIGITEIAQMFLFYLVTAFTVGCVGIFFSTFLKKTTGATVVTYGAGIIFSLGIIFIVYIVAMMSRNGSGASTYMSSTHWFTYINPLSGFGSLIFSQLGIDGSMPKILVGSINGSELAVWKIDLIFDVLLSILLIAVSARKLNPIKKVRIKGMKK
jgi:ABC-type transport system involved in multi-copper enzyme maturation permease subunit